MAELTTTILIFGIILFCCIEWWTFRGKCDLDGKAFKAIAEWMERQEAINREFRKVLQQKKEVEG